MCITTNLSSLWCKKIKFWAYNFRELWLLFPTNFRNVPPGLKSEKGHKYQARKAKKECAAHVQFSSSIIITFLHFTVKKMIRNICEIHFSLKSTNKSCFTYSMYYQFFVSLCGSSVQNLQSNYEHVLITLQFKSK